MSVKKTILLISHVKEDAVLQHHGFTNGMLVVGIYSYPITIHPRIYCPMLKDWVLYSKRAFTVLEIL